MRKLKITILSLSLVTVMSGAAVAPALGEIANYFSKVDPLLIKLIITLPALFIIFTSLLFSLISSRLSSKTIAISGLFLYLIGGCGAGFVNNIYLLLAFRSILGIGVGLIMPLSTGLIAYFFDKNEQSKLMGYSSAMNNLGGIMATVLSGYLVSLNWRYSFAIYLLGLFVVILVIWILPKSKMGKTKSSIDIKSIRKIAPYVFAMFITMVIFYTVPSNFSIIVTKENLVPTSFIGLLMSVQNITSFIIGLALYSIVKNVGRYTKYFASGMLALGLLGLSSMNHVITIIFGLFSLGVGLGIMVPLLNAQIALHVDKEKMTSAMAIMSAMLYLGQFSSPIFIDGVRSLFHLQGLQMPFHFAMILSIALMISFIRIPISIAKNH
ncbi:MFS transporter [Sediminispirochaeta bajacaliforniensis]|uniref:MFS transporter n=1 Tax=Sediminispirochaeta bajacaliforniensis TaxID=148 RepID=UPI0003719B13|nr:MFS transporter [Sediminispirochaeta bajacaliforniensis]